MDLMKYRIKLSQAKHELERARRVYKAVRNECPHPETHLDYKEKYGGYYCNVCESFLPRNFKPGQE